jgi:hypothetical protein
MGGVPFVPGVTSDIAGGTTSCARTDKADQKKIKRLRFIALKRVLTLPPVFFTAKL